MTDLAESLASAWREGRALDAAAWRDGVGDAAQAYGVQDRVAQAMGWFGTAVPGHWKSGGPSRDAVLTHAPLPPAGVRASPANYSDMHFNAPGIESEIALRLGEAVTPERAAALTPETAAALIDAMAVSIEIVDSRWEHPANASALLRLADQQSHGALVLGDWVPYSARDWAAQTCETRIGSSATDLRKGAHSMGDPAWLLPIWLRHATRNGATVPAGTVVTTGSWVGVLPVGKGDTVVVEFPGIGRAEARL
ncbi:fumarylacetoacetate hydrolase family protein [Variovorax sp. J22R24]|uniref:fumarylacetoacetate hydrolase family protein n=1 Tax=Variovorax gracilis TaxID=3053502 RepID=UPI002575FC94|nr:fumarylacetoacetate hydrolase family protein [Variovorax sp. J22R24]MDM0107205.1 fumarylacetoacetate hydrolase family protein [Variovorax sp. J22R24]